MNLVLEIRKDLGDLFVQNFKTNNMFYPKHVFIHAYSFLKN